MTCDHNELYKCSRCGKCYQCEHTIVKYEWPGISVGWECPDGFIKPAYGPYKKKNNDLKT